MMPTRSGLTLCSWSRQVVRPERISNSQLTLHSALSICGSQPIFHASHAFYDRISHFILLAPELETGFDWSWKVRAHKTAARSRSREGG